MNGREKKVKRSAKILCALCKRKLSGVPHNKSITEIAKMPKSEKRPSRIFAGTLCNICSQSIVRESALLKDGAREMKDISLKKKIFVEEALKKGEK